MNRRFQLIASAAVVLAAVSCFGQVDMNNRTALADEVEQHLRTEVLSHWFPVSVDRVEGGFHSSYDRQWKPQLSEWFSVFQARMTWIAAHVAIHRPDLRDEYLDYTKHGIDYLDGTLWDKEHGGFHWGMGRDDRPSASWGPRKHAYGQAFAIYALAEAYEATKDPRAIELAKKGFEWMETHAHDKDHGGYFDWLEADGTPVPYDPNDYAVESGMSPPGYKSMNAHIHLLEAWANLYRVWPDPRVRTRLEELLLIVRDKITVDPGVMHLWFAPDWTPIPDHDSYGHDIETGYLLLEAAEILGTQDDPETQRKAKLLVDHTLQWGIDPADGAVFGRGPTFGEAWGREKDWWAQFEGFNAALLMHELHGRDDPKYANAFARLWSVISGPLNDKEFGGHYFTVPVPGERFYDAKGSDWKAPYHEVRSLMNVSDRLRTLTH